MRATRFTSIGRTTITPQRSKWDCPIVSGLRSKMRSRHFRGETQERSFSIEGRYALADWDKIPLNPTIFVEYKFGIGDILHDEGPPEPLERRGGSGIYQ